MGPLLAEGIQQTNDEYSKTHGPIILMLGLSVASEMFGKPAELWFER